MRQRRQKESEREWVGKAQGCHGNWELSADSMFSTSITTQFPSLPFSSQSVHLSTASPLPPFISSPFVRRGHAPFHLSLPFSSDTPASPSHFPPTLLHSSPSPSCSFHSSSDWTHCFILSAKSAPKRMSLNSMVKKQNRNPPTDSCERYDLRDEMREKRNFMI